MHTDLELAKHISHESLNATIGIELFIGSSIWDDTKNSLAERLKWPIESRTKIQPGFRYYPPKNYQILGCRPNSAALYGNENKAAHLSLVFANKSDFPFSNIPQKNEIASMKASIKADTEQIKDKLTKAH